MESRCGGQMENIQHMARVECVTAGEVRLFSENTQVSSGSPGFALNNIFLLQNLSLFFFSPHILFLSLFGKEEPYFQIVTSSLSGKYMGSGTK